MKQYLQIGLLVLCTTTIHAQERSKDELIDTTVLTSSDVQGGKSGRFFSESGNEIFNENTQNRGSLGNDFITNKSFTNSLRKIRNIRNSYARKLACKKLINTYGLSTKQILALANLLQGYAKLDILQYGYTRCTDPYNFDYVYNTLSYDLRQELEDYIDYIDNPVVYHENDDYYWNNSNMGFNTLSPQSFADLKQTIQATAFENTKLSTAKSALSKNKITTQQVIEICRLFSFENTKLAFAQYAYNYTSDKHNYFKVNSVFDFDNSKVALNNTISQ